ncbi:MAG: CinA family nicotinamide mononucleotide deamidase-related protein [Saprospiraceae bacterium]
MNVNIVTIGDEILIGQIIDTNSAWIGQQLNLIGAKVTSIHSVSDTVAGINNALNNALAQADVVLITGGLGPTKDDITKKTLADYFGTALTFHEPTWERIQEMFQRLGRNTTPAHKAQCFLPSNAKILFNKMGTAPGMWFETNGKIAVSMPGVPSEMKYLMESEVLPKLANYFSGKPIAHRTILTVGEREAIIEERLADFVAALPDFIKIAYLPKLGRIRIRLSAIAENGEPIESILAEKVKEIERLIPELIYGYGKITLEAAVVKMLKDRGLTLATAEDATGGFLAHKIVSVPDSTAYFKGSIIAFDNEIKERQLGVKQATLKEQGATSEAIAKEMVLNVLNTLQTNIAIAITGIVDSEAATPDRPSGTIWVAISNNQQTNTIKLQLGKNRLQNIEYIAVQALNSIRQFLNNYYPPA